MPWSEGWSPYEARTFLKDDGLTTNDYHHSGSDWWAESPMLDIGGGIIHDRLTYRIAGTETAATRLSLELNANTPGTPEASDARFWETAQRLVARALGADAVQLFATVRGQNEATIGIAGTTMMLRHDEWGDHLPRGGYSRRFTLRHAAHHELHPGLD